MVRFLLIDPMVSGSNPSSAKILLRVKKMQNLDVGDLVYRPTKVISTLENNFACTEFNFIYSQPILQPLSVKAYLNGRLDREEQE